MNYLSVENISKSFGERTLFENISFGINKDQKIAFVAKNGTGKTSILKIITGEDMPDTGQVVIRKEIKMAFLSQEPKLDPELTIEVGCPDAILRQIPSASTRGIGARTWSRR